MVSPLEHPGWITPQRHSWMPWITSCHLVEGDPEFEKEFYAASTPDEMVTLAVDGGILIDAEDFRALLRSGSTEFWLVRGEEGANPIAHLQQVFSV